jgi:hypothetical protein
MRYKKDYGLGEYDKVSVNLQDAWGTSGKRMTAEMLFSLFVCLFVFFVCLFVCLFWGFLFSFLGLFLYNKWTACNYGGSEQLGSAFYSKCVNCPFARILRFLFLYFLCVPLFLIWIFRRRF